MKNKNLQIIVCIGLPASGKTTFAKQWINEDPDNRVHVEKDEIRKDKRLFKNGLYDHARGDEAIVLKERDRLIHQALNNGKDVISSDTNLVKKHLAQISNIAKKYNATVEIKEFLDVPLSELIERDKNRDNSVGEQVIRKMFHNHVRSLPTFLKYDASLKMAIISDLDGTLTLGPKNRSPYEWNKVGNDDINLGISHILDGIKLMNYAKLFIFSGRDSSCRKQTEEWLERHDIEYDALYMRPEGDNRSDEIIKAEMIEKYIKDKYNVLIWFDDRPRICRMLQDVYGINVAKIGDQNYDF